ncbi:MAG: AAA family ATPase [Clostridia bacterium]|nr:AAA family ATPase [Clostridia bacterium]
MILKKIEIEQFGGLKNFALELTPGLQYLYGENEAGKSTICAFLSAMFYGLPGKVRGGGLRGDSRKLYMPWGENYMAGSLEFEFEGESYVLQRRFGQTARGDRCTLLLAKDWQEVAIEPEEIGQRFLGLGEDAFQKTLFISQSGAAFSKGKEDELMSRLANLEQSGDEDVFLQKALDILSKSSHELISKTGRGGAIMQLETEIEELKSELLSASQLHESFGGAMGEKEQLSAEKEQADAELLSLEKQRNTASLYEQYQKREVERNSRKEMLRRLENEKQALAEKEETAQALNEKKKDYAGFKELSLDILLMMAEKDAKCSVLQKREEERQKLEQETEALSLKVGEQSLLEKSGEGKGLMWSAIAIVVVSTLAGFLFSPVFYGLVLVAVVLFLLYFNKTKLIKSANDTLKELTMQLAEKQSRLSEMNGAGYSEELCALKKEMQQIYEKTGTKTLQELSDRQREAQEIEHQAERLQDEMDRMRDGIHKLMDEIISKEPLADEPPMDYDGPSADSLTLQLTQKQKAQMERERDLAQLQAKIEQGFMGERSISVIETELLDAMQKKEELMANFEAINLAKNALESCHETLKSTFAPLLNEKSGAIVSRLTKGRYLEIKVADDYSMMIKTPKGNEIVEADYVSAGTCDLLYFALRLGVIETLYDSIPLLVMDDTFIQMDEIRQEEAFSFLADSPAEQILYFSCHKPPETFKNTVNNLSV